jgi:hypothetical protein
MNRLPEVHDEAAVFWAGRGDVSAQPASDIWRASSTTQRSYERERAAETK